MGYWDEEEKGRGKGPVKRGENGGSGVRLKCYQFAHGVAFLNVLVTVWVCVRGGVFERVEELAPPVTPGRMVEEAAL